MDKKYNKIKNFETLAEATLNNYLEEPKTKKFKKNQHHLSDLELVIGLYKLLLFDFDKYSTKWSLECLVQMITSTKNPIVKWFALKITSLLLGLSSIDESSLFNSHFNADLLQQTSLKVEEILIDDFELELNPNEDAIRTNFSKRDYDYFRMNQDIDTDFVRFDNGPKLSINQQNSSREQTNLIFVDTTKGNLNKIVMSVITDQCIVVEGELSSGKTSLIEYLSEKSGNKLVKYQMDEFMDSKSLIGNYVCSDIPGEFVWKPGPLFSSVQNGFWILLEDFDHAPVDSLSLLIDLLETKSIKTSDNKIVLNDNFRLFLTLRPSDGKQINTNFIDSIKKLSRSVCLDSLMDEEIIRIICDKYTSFKIASSAHLAEKLLDIYRCLDFSKQIETNGEMIRLRDNRYLSLRDLLKVCNRMRNDKTNGSRDMILGMLNDVYECFMGFISNKSARNEYAVKVGAKLNINRDEVEAFLINKKPAFMNKDGQIVCGRVKLKSEKSDAQYGQMKFVYTKSALNLLEKIARCIECNEPVLLCGETGVGKTTALQHLAALLGKKISVINLNQQTETSDLLGSFKPIDIKTQMKILKDKFVGLFAQCFSVDENKTFLNHVQTCYSKSNWKYLLRLISHATESACKKFTKQTLEKWKDLKQQCNRLDENLSNLINKFTFQFFDGKLSEAIVNGEWIILDEINLASAETLQFLGSLLDNTESGSSSIILYERGDHEPLIRHAGFRLFAAMNPASDVGKRNLPSNIRNRFTEIFVDELDDHNDLGLLTKSYLEFLPDISANLINSIVNFYATVRNGDFLKKLSNGTDMPPTYSLRTLCRALKNASTNSCNNSLISIYDSMCLSFLTDLNRESSILLEEYIQTSILKSKNKTKLRIQRNRPQVELYSSAFGLKPDRLNYINIEDYWILKGELECVNDSSFIFTKSASDNLKRLCRVCAARLPCLIQGDTSIGKTSLIKWLAAATGNRLIRINNHDHTDLAEYIGSYVIDSESNLVFKEGLLVEAMRNGYWILLDELNLASSEVLEALNRVLDDNRELYIPETQQVIKAHPRFLLFATQNPPGKYAGRKQLSKAFRNRFIELHYDELPEQELLVIVEKKCHLPKSYATLLIKSISDLKTKRSQVSGIFLGKDSLITLRDLFRWARRYSKADDDPNETNIDWKQYLAEQGFLLLTSRCRSEQDVLTIHASIEKSFGKKIDINELNEPKNLCPSIMKILTNIIDYAIANFKDYVWTPSAKRIALLAGLAYKFNEPFLLVGETGVGKTTICQILSQMYGKKLSIVNCHMHSEASDFLGSMRPVRESEPSGKLFEWKDGPLVCALKHGDDFLIDEISLADDSVLERLNSVLEEEKTLLLAENINQSHSIHANENFRISATMNPSGDFGKKELSAALRNRFTEIWCPAPSKNSQDFKIILEHSLRIENAASKQVCVSIIVDFLGWLSDQTFFKSVLSIRDLSQWINFMNKMSHLDPFKLIVHAACLVFIDSFSSDLDYSKPREQCIDYLTALIESKNPQFKQSNIEINSPPVVLNRTSVLECGDFHVKKGEHIQDNNTTVYVLDSQTTVSNLLRVMRCMVMDSAIMLEGSPGVGKTSLIEALGRLTNNKVIRINLSEQTDLNELFGADLPVSDASTFQQKFEWLDGPLLLALKQGYWVILDEINLASQSVLEGLNSCLDHRGEIFISELNRTFTVDKNKTKIFACQNPYSQGGGRKGLPKSFLNRFAKVYVDKMSHEDLLRITESIYAIERDTLSKMISFNTLLNKEVCVEKKWGTLGSPWEFNLRDLFRWCDLLIESKSTNASDFVYLVYASRFRDPKDKQFVYDRFKSVFGLDAYKQQSQLVRLTRTHIQIGQSILATNVYGCIDQNFVLTNTNLKYLESIVKCVEMNWMVVLVGRSSTGKTSLVRLVAALLGKNLVEFSVNSSTDTSDLLGGYEKIKHLKQTLICLRSKIINEYRKRALNNLAVMSQYFDFVFKTKKLFDLNDQDMDQVKLMCDVFKHELESLQMKNELIVLNKVSHYEKMKFEWLDSALVKSIENGDWVLIDNANFCAPSVLDRLNPLLEKNGRLQINEKGIQADGQLVQIEQNKNFRLFLSMNEQFGELSRPMRNRGCEIYLNELDVQNDMEDVFIILKTLFPLDKYFYSSTKFANLFQVYKLAYDYWLLDNQDSEACFIKSIVECKIKSEYTALPPIVQFHTNISKIKSSKIYSFLFNYPLMPAFKENINGQLFESRDLDLINLHAYHQLILRKCNYVKVLVNNMPVGAINHLVKYLAINLKNLNLKNFFKNLFNGQFMNAYVKSVRELGVQAQMELDAETVQLTNNIFLCKKLVDFSKFNYCHNLSKIFSVYLNLELFKFRIHFLYTIQSDSFYYLVEKNSQLSHFKYLLLVKDFVSLFSDCVLASRLDQTDQHDTIQLCILLVEKFYLILSSRYDQLLTMSYLKYYWNLIRVNIHRLQDEMDNIWSAQFKSIASLFDQNLSYDDSLYKIYYSLWSQQNNQHLDVYNDKTLSVNLDTIADFMTSNSFNSIMSCRNFTKSINNLIAALSSQQITVSLSRDQIQILLKHIEHWETKNLSSDLKHELNVLLNRSYPLMLNHYLDIFNSLLIKKRNKALVNYASLSELIIDDFLFDLSSKCTYKNLNLFKSIDYLLSIDNLDSELISGYKPDSLESLNILAFDFLNWFMPKILLNSEHRLDLTLDLYDVKINLIHTCVNYVWSNYKLLSNKQANVELINQQMLNQVRNELNFVSSADIQAYLHKRGFDKRFLDHSHSVHMNLLVYGLFYLVMYCPMDPLDPVEHDTLIQKNQLIMSDSRKHLDYLTHKNLVCRLKICLDTEPQNSDNQLIERLNKPVYYLIKSEIENFLKQFLSYEQISKLIDNSQPGQFNNWLSSIETLINKLKSYYNYSDVIGGPVRGLSLVWYAMSCMYTESRAKTNTLAQCLIQFPVMDQYGEIADKLSSVESDDLYLVALMNIVNCGLVEPGSDLTHLIVKVCNYFKNKYFEYKRKIEEAEHVHAYKYKQYGQEKIEQEIDDQEFEDKFPNYEHNFSEFIQINVLDDENRQKETRAKKDSEILLFEQVFDLVEKIYDSCEHTFITDTFFKSYTIATRLIGDKQVLQNSNKNTLLSHLFYSTCVNLKQESKYFDIYHDANSEQVLVLKNYLGLLTKRIECVLNDWPDNPVLIELTKIVKKIESFNLNDPLMKYLTGIELLLGRADSWQLIASREVSLDAELKSLNQLVVEWRKLELKQWMNSCDSEINKIKKEFAFIWFFNIYSTCQEYLTTDESHDNFMSTLNKFMLSSPIGQFFVRLKSIQICHFIFDKSESTKSASLSKILWSVFDFYSSVYSAGVGAEIAKQQAEIDKELADFVSIYKWQEATYWSIKNSVAKSNRHFVRTIKKFKTFLKSEIGWLKLTRALSVDARHRLWRTDFNPEPNTNNIDYAFKMQKFCARILNKKFKNNKFNKYCAQFIVNVWQRFDDLAAETRHLNNQFVCDKKNADKYKKEFKYLNQEKLKFMSDLIKRLSLMGLSYRKGQIMCHRYASIEQVILDQKHQPDSHYEFYLSTRLYFDYKSTSPNQQAANLPVDKFNGFVNYMFSLLHTQRLNLTMFSVDSSKLDSLNARLTIIAKSSGSFDELKSAKSSIYFKLRCVHRTLRKLLVQIKCFYENLFNLGQSETVKWITDEYDQVKNALEKVLNLIPKEKSPDKLEFIFADPCSDCAIDRESLDHLGALIKKHCEPFYEYYAQCLSHLDFAANQHLYMEPSDGAAGPNPSIELLAQRTTAKLLKIIENFYKKYSNYSIKDLESDQFFSIECLQNFTNDIKSFELKSLIKQVEKILDLSGSCGSNIVEHVSKLKTILDIFCCYANTYEQYLSQMHVKCCQMLETLIKVFDEYKQGLSVPKELEQDEEAGKNDDAEEKKFETDEAAGLGEGQGAKDVSDQIESEDQLDDAKTKQEREEQEQQDEQQEEKVKEEEKGIEMSEDFEAQMDDVNMQEEDDADQENDEQEEDLDDQKADVDNAMDYLDQQLWDQEDNEQADEQDEQDQSVDEDIHGGQKLDDQSELMAKEQDLPMIDNEPNANEPDSEQNEQNEQLDNEQEQDLGEEQEIKENEVQNEQENDMNEQNKIEDIENLSENEDQNEKENQQEEINEKIEEHEVGEEEQEEKEEEENKKENLAENSKNYGFNNESENKSENESKLNSCGVENNENNDELNEEQNDEIDMNQQAENEIKSGQGQNEFSVNSSKPLDEQSANVNRQKNRIRDKNQNRIVDNSEQKLDAMKNLNIVDLDETNEANESETNEQENAVDFKHLNNEEEKYDRRVFDAATDEQKRKPPIDQTAYGDQEPEMDQQHNDMPNNLENKEKKHLKASKVLDEKHSEKNDNEINEQGKDENSEMQIDDYVSTVRIERPSQSLFATIKENLILSEEINRDVVEKDLAKFREASTSQIVECESLKLWLEYEAITQQLSRELCEQLRLILEPTVCSKLKGDYKTGKRLNMKRVVEYIATEYRKDKIWLRRTKPNKRDYQVVLAVDNSSSMSDNHCMQLAYETIATLTNAFSLLEVGQFGLLSFGQQVQLLHSLDQHFNSDVGARILSNINFNDDRTKIAEMLDTSIGLFSNTNSNTAVSKLLIILSDGRGVFYEGIDKVKSSVQRALLEGIFIVFVILDITDKTAASIYDIKMPVYTPGNPIPAIKSYMESFPFPFYVCLREVNSLPLIMIEALKQWFDMVSRVDS